MYITDHYLIQAIDLVNIVYTRIFIYNTDTLNDNLYRMTTPLYRPLFGEVPSNLPYNNTILMIF